MVKISFYVPEASLEAVKNAMFDAGGGRIGQYEQCSWQALGVGQFRPLPGSHPSVGSVGSLERVEEYQVEMVCDDAVLPAVVAALKRAHPYETPAYGAWQLLELP